MMDTPAPPKLVAFSMMTSITDTPTTKQSNRFQLDAKYRARPKPYTYAHAKCEASIDMNALDSYLDQKLHCKRGCPKVVANIQPEFVAITGFGKV